MNTRRNDFSILLCAALSNYWYRLAADPDLSGKPDLGVAAAGTAAGGTAQERICCFCKRAVSATVEADVDVEEVLVRLGQAGQGGPRAC